MSIPRMVDTDGIGVFKVEAALSEVQEWLVDVDAEMVEVNGAFDEAASFAADHGRSYVLVEIVKPPAPSPQETEG